jgi:Macro domain
MIEEGHGNLLTAEADALVNTVNTVGVMGKGIALQFKRAHPDNYAAYRDACDRGEVSIGHIFVFDTGRLGPGRFTSTSRPSGTGARRPGWRTSAPASTTWSAWSANSASAPSRCPRWAPATAGWTGGTSGH